MCRKGGGGVSCTGGNEQGKKRKTKPDQSIEDYFIRGKKYV